jgi:hypothetical protein
VAKSLREASLPVLFFLVGAFWIAVIATGGGYLLLWAALAAVLSGAAVVAAPSNWVTRPLAGAGSLFVLMLAIYQAYEASTLFGTSMASLGAESLAAFVILAVISLYLVAATISTSLGLSSVSKS